MIRKLFVPVLLVAVAAGATVQAARTDESTDPGEAPIAGPPDAMVATPLLSVRRVPEWLRQPLSDTLLTTEVRSVTAVPTLPDESCLLVHRDGEAILARDPSGASFVPASAQKVLTAAAILELAPEDTTFRTEVVMQDGAEVVDGRLEGDVWIVGGGDPVLSTPDYVNRYDEPRAFTDLTVLADDVAGELAARGITTIGGRLIADESYFDLPGQQAQRDYTDDVLDDGTQIWKNSYVRENQAGPLSALLVNDGYTAWPDEPSRRQNVRAADPADAAAELFADLLSQRGIGIEGRVVNGTPISEIAPLQATTLGAIESPPLSDVIVRMLRHSDNTTAEMLFKQIGIRAGVRAQRATAWLGVVSSLRDSGFDVEGLVVADGSGLSTSNRVRCSLLVSILDSFGPDSALVRALAVVGESGTLRSCLDGDPDADDGSVFGKTGTLNDVTALTGMTVADNGDVITFAVIGNGEGVGTELGGCNEIQTTLIDAVAGHPYGPDVGALEPRPAVAG